METSATTINNRPSQDCTHPNNQTTLSQTFSCLVTLLFNFLGTYLLFLLLFFGKKGLYVMQLRRISFQILGVGRAWGSGQNMGYWLHCENSAMIFCCLDSYRVQCTAIQLWPQTGKRQLRCHSMNQPQEKGRARYK